MRTTSVWVWQLRGQALEDGINVKTTAPGKE